MTNLERNYKDTLTAIQYDNVIKNLREVKKNLSGALRKVESGIHERRSQIAIEFKVGYRGNDEMRYAYPGGEEVSRKTINGVTIVVMQDKEGKKHPHYYSCELGIFVKGKPKVERKNAYCQITGTNLTKLFK